MRTGNKPDFSGELKSKSLSKTPTENLNIFLLCTLVETITQAEKTF